MSDRGRQSTEQKLDTALEDLVAEDRDHRREERRGRDGSRGDRRRPLGKARGGKGGSTRRRIPPEDKALLNTRVFFDKIGDFVIRLHETEVFVLKRAADEVGAQVLEEPPARSPAPEKDGAGPEAASAPPAAEGPGVDAAPGEAAASADGGPGDGGAATGDVAPSPGVADPQAGSDAATQVASPAATRAGGDVAAGADAADGPQGVDGESGGPAAPLDEAEGPPQPAAPADAAAGAPLTSADAASAERSDGAAADAAALAGEPEAPAAGQSAAPSEQSGPGREAEASLERNGKRARASDAEGVAVNLRLTSGGFRTVETRFILNEALHWMDLRVSDGDESFSAWIVKGDGVCRKFEDGMELVVRRPKVEVEAIQRHFEAKIGQARSRDEHRDGAPAGQRGRGHGPPQGGPPPPQHFHLGWPPPGYFPEGAYPLGKGGPPGWRGAAFPPPHGCGGPPGPPWAGHYRPSPYGGPPPGPRPAGPLPDSFFQ